ncbi:hypothetical protein H2248_009130 [Termitomyces sp. 'cryptogamus']|nr:hypothetical protein H2248_009130 [Termitomyces sp. 'cryptogamus']
MDLVIILDIFVAYLRAMYSAIFKFIDIEAIRSSVHSYQKSSPFETKNGRMEAQPHRAFDISCLSIVVVRVLRSLRLVDPLTMVRTLSYKTNRRRSAGKTAARGEITAYISRTRP